MWQLRYQPHFARYPTQGHAAGAVSVAGRMKEENAENGAQNHGHDERPQLADGAGHVVVVVPLRLEGAENLVPQSPLAVALVVFGTERLSGGGAVEMLGVGRGSDGRRWTFVTGFGPLLDLARFGGNEGHGCIAAGAIMQVLWIAC